MCIFLYILLHICIFCIFLYLLRVTETSGTQKGDIFTSARSGATNQQPNNVLPYKDKHANEDEFHDDDDDDDGGDDDNDDKDDNDDPSRLYLRLW